MALFHIDALFTNDLLQQIINVDDVVLQLIVRNPIGEECITAGQCQTDDGPTSCIRNSVAGTPLANRMLKTQVKSNIAHKPSMDTITGTFCLTQYPHYVGDLTQGPTWVIH